MKTDDLTADHMIALEDEVSELRELNRQLAAALEVTQTQLNHNTDLMGEATARIAVLQKSLRDVTRLWYKQKETIELLQTALQEKATLQ